MKVINTIYYFLSPSMTAPLVHTLSIIIGALQLLVVVILLLFYRTNKNVNVFLIFIVIYAVIKSFYIRFNTSETEMYFNTNGIGFSLLTFFAVASSYLYLKKIVNNEKMPNRKDLVHFVFPVLWTTLVYLQSFFGLIQEKIWVIVRNVNVSIYVVLYAIASMLVLKDFYRNRNKNAYSTVHYSAIKNWVFIFFICMILINFRALLHFCFDFDSIGGLTSQFSAIMKTIFWLVILFIVLTTPEILFGYEKLRKSISNDPEKISGNQIMKRGTEYYLNNKSMDSYFKGKSLECLVFLLDNNKQFIQLSELDGLFDSEFHTTLPTIKKRRDLCLKEIQQVLSTRLDVPVDSTIVKSSDDSDKRIKMIKINPELLSFG